MGAGLKGYHRYSDYARFPGGRKKIDYLMTAISRLAAPGVEGKLRVLDVGCGNGSISFPLASVGHQVIGVDIDEASVAYCRGHSSFNNASFQCVPDGRLPFKDSFDVVVCSEVLEHLAEPQVLVNDMFNALLRGGLLLITVPNGYGAREVLGRFEKFLRVRLRLDGLVRLLRRTAGMMSAEEKHAMHTSNPDQEHVQKFKWGRLRRTLEQSGLTVLEQVNSFVILSVFLRKGRIGELVERVDCRAADLLPAFMASGWYVASRK
ncbi:MAG: class I SAM-dependent methyltransferase [Acidobacteriota bacterium]